MTINKTQAANNIGVSLWFSRLMTARDAVIKATWMYSRRILRAAWIQAAVCS